MVTYGHVKTSKELHEILALQKKNLRQHLADEEIASQGFVYVEHDFENLSRMNVPRPHVIAKYEDKVVGYTLVLLKENATDVPILNDLFKKINAIAFEGKLVKNEKYFVMGQVCIEKAFRSKKIFQGLYDFLKQSMKDDFDFIITEVSVDNKRSLRAHEKIGFVPLIDHTDKFDQTWRTIIMKI